jgi:two-component system nitrate/nitrite response regulator NarL
LSVRVLICDDHPIVRDAIAVCLNAIVPDCEVGVCGTVRDVIDRLDEPDAWDLVVLDLGLPDATGLDALIRVRRRTPSTKVAVLSVLEDRDTVERAMRAGANAFLPKSSERGVLVDALQRLLGVLPEPLEATARRGDDAWVHEALAALSPRRMQVLRWMVRGLSNKEICAELGLSENTVKIHIAAVLRALRARNRTEAVAVAGRVGFGVH